MAWKTSNPTKQNIRKALLAAEEAMSQAEKLMVQNGMSGALDAVQAAQRDLTKAISFHAAGR